MSKNHLPFSGFKLSPRRRLIHLQPMFNFIWSILNDAPSKKTEDKYRRDYQRMIARDLWPEQIGENSRRSFNAYRSSLVWCTILRIAALYDEAAEHGASMSTRQAHELVNQIEAEIAILRRYPPRSQAMPSMWRAPAGGPVHKSKRRGLGKVPPLWRQQLLKACPASSKYFLALLVLMLTGLRPAELQHGVRVTMQGAEIAVIIRGAKVTMIAGQPERTLWFGLDNPLTAYLAKRVQASAGAGFAVSIKSPGALCNFVRRLSRRVFWRRKYVISPYSYRHAFASDRKAEKVPPENIGAMLGHAVDRSQRGYGCSSQGRTLCRVVGFAATRAVRAVPVSKAAAAWMAAKPSLANHSRCSPSLSAPAPRMM